MYFSPCIVRHIMHVKFEKETWSWIQFESDANLGLHCGTNFTRIITCYIISSSIERNPNGYYQKTKTCKLYKTKTCKLCIRRPVAQVTHAATEVTLHHIRAFTCWIMRSAQLVGSAPLLVQPARVGTPFFLTQAQAFVIPVRAVMGLLMGFTVRPRHVARTNVAFHSCKCPQKRV